LMMYVTRLKTDTDSFCISLLVEYSPMHCETQGCSCSQIC